MVDRQPDERRRERGGDDRDNDQRYQNAGQAAPPASGRAARRETPASGSASPPAVLRRLRFRPRWPGIRPDRRPRYLWQIRRGAASSRAARPRAVSRFSVYRQSVMLITPPRSPSSRLLRITGNVDFPGRGTVAAQAGRCIIFRRRRPVRGLVIGPSRLPRMSGSFGQDGDISFSRITSAFRRHRRGPRDCATKPRRRRHLDFGQPDRAATK